MANEWILLVSLVTLCTWQFGLVCSSPEYGDKVEIRKCCAWKQVWNVQKHACVPTGRRKTYFPKMKELISWSVAGENYSVITGNSCSESTSLQFVNPLDSLQDYVEVTDGIMLKNDTHLSFDQFCVDRMDTFHKLIVMACLEPNWTQSHSSNPKIHINHCCQPGKIYGERGCEPAPSKLWPPGVVDGNRKILQVFDTDWDVNYGHVNCTVDEKRKLHSSRDITRIDSRIVLYGNGTLYVEQYDTLYPPNKFCVNEAFLANVSQTMVMVCYEDPCQNKTCVRRCCPKGLAMNLSSEECNIPESSPLQLEFKDGNDNVIPNNDLIETHYLFGKPFCENRGHQPIYSLRNKKKIYLTLQGELYRHAHTKNKDAIKDYCVAYFGDISVPLQLNAIVCSPNDDSADFKLAVKVYSYFFLFSSIFLFATLVVYAILPELQNLHGMTVMCYVFCLFISYLCLGIVQFENPVRHCVILAVVIHFFFLSAFTWMGTMSFDIVWTFTGMRIRRPGQENHMPQFVKYSIFAWGAPLIIVATGQILDSVKDDLPDWVITPSFGGERCWFPSNTGKREKLYFFYGPVAVILIANLLFFVRTALTFYIPDNISHTSIRSSRARQRVRVVLSISVLMGVTWIMEVVSWAVGGKSYYWMATDILNILQAVLIFVIFVCKRKVLRLLHRRCLSLQKTWCATILKYIVCYRSTESHCETGAKKNGLQGPRLKGKGSCTTSEQTAQTNIRESNLLSVAAHTSIRMKNTQIIRDSDLPA